MARLELGGYLALERLGPAENSQTPHAHAVALNSGRNALRYLLTDSSFDRIYLPAYICGAVTDVLNAMAVPFELYETSTGLTPLLGEIEPGARDCVLLVNYFGVMCTTLRALASSFPHTIVDNTQAFFSECHGSAGSFFSPRKFFGVPDGGYAHAPVTRAYSPPRDDSAPRLDHLNARRERGAAAGYQAYLENESHIATQPMRGMSAYTAGVLAQLDYAAIAEIRNSNFRALHRELEHRNELDLDPDTVCGPMAYPLLLKNAGTVREQLIARSIFIPRYWPDMPVTRPDSCAHYLADNLLPLPIDQNIGERELNHLLENLSEFL